MQKIPSVSNQLDKEKFFKVINENFSTLAPAYYTLITSWLIDAYKVYKGIDKFIILIIWLIKTLYSIKKKDK